MQEFILIRTLRIAVMVVLYNLQLKLEPTFNMEQCELPLHVMVSSVDMTLKCADIHGPQWRNHTDFNDPLTFSFVSPTVGFI